MRAALLVLVLVGATACSDRPSPTAPSNGPAPTGKIVLPPKRTILDDLVIPLIPSKFSKTAAITLKAGSSCENAASDDRVVGDITLTLVETYDTAPYTKPYLIRATGRILRQYAPRSLAGEIYTLDESLVTLSVTFHEPLLRDRYASITSGSKTVPGTLAEKIYRGDARLNMDSFPVNYVDAIPGFCARFLTR